MKTKVTVQFIQKGAICNFEQYKDLQKCHQNLLWKTQYTKNMLFNYNKVTN